MGGAQEVFFILFSGSDFVVSYNQSTGQARLEVLGVRERHCGQFQCVASNDAGSAACSCQLTIATSSVSSSSASTEANKGADNENCSYS